MWLTTFDMLLGVGMIGSAQDRSALF